MFRIFLKTVCCMWIVKVCEATNINHNSVLNMTKNIKPLISEVKLSEQKIVSMLDNLTLLVAQHLAQNRSAVTTEEIFKSTEFLSIDTNEDNLIFDIQSDAVFANETLNNKPVNITSLNNRNIFDAKCAKGFTKIAGKCRRAVNENETESQHTNKQEVGLSIAQLIVAGSVNVIDSSENKDDGTSHPEYQQILEDLIEEIFSTSSTEELFSTTTDIPETTMSDINSETLEIDLTDSDQMSSNETFNDVAKNETKSDNIQVSEVKCAKGYSEFDGDCRESNEVGSSNESSLFDDIANWIKDLLN